MINMRTILFLTCLVISFSSFSANAEPIETSVNAIIPAQGEVLTVSKKGERYVFVANAPENNSHSVLCERLVAEVDEVLKASEKKGKVTLEFTRDAAPDRVEKALRYAAMLYGYADVIVK